MTNYPIEVGPNVWLNPAHVAQVRVKRDGESLYKVIWLSTPGRQAVLYSMPYPTEFEAKAAVADYRAAVAEAESRGV